MTAATDAFDPFECDHPDGYLADTQFDYPGRPGGWQYHALGRDNDFARFQPSEASRDTATPLAYLTCDDEHARVGRDVVHPGYTRRPCLQWHAPAPGTYRIDGEAALVRSVAHGHFRVRVVVDDTELLTQSLAYPQVLTFEIDAAVRQDGFVRVVFECERHIDDNEALFCLRVRQAERACETGESRVASRCEAPAAWARLRQVLGAAAHAEPDALARVATGMYRQGNGADAVLQHLVQEAGRRHFAPRLARFRKPRFFSIHPKTPDTEQGSWPPPISTPS